MTVFIASFMTISALFAEVPERVSVPIGKTPEANLLSSQRPQLSADGRYIVFESFAKLTADDTDSMLDVYLYDRKVKRLRLIPSKRYGRYNGGPFISADGELIAFHTTSKGDIKRRIPRTSDINLFHVRDGSSVHLTEAKDGKPHNGEALFPRFAKNAEIVVFTSNGTNLVEDKFPPVRQIYTYDRRTGVIGLVSRNSDSQPANRPCAEPRISKDGDIVVFRSAATNLVPGIPLESLSVHIYYLNLLTDSLFRVDDAIHGFDGNALTAGAFDMDADGRTIVLEGRWRDPHDHTAGLENIDLYLFDISSKSVQLITTGIFSRRSQSPSISADGRFIAFVFKPDKEEEVGDPGGVVVYDRQEDQWRRVATGWCASPVISQDGSTIAYELIEEKISPRRIKKRVRNVYLISNPFKE